MLRSETPFPSEFDNLICSFLKRIWQEGWLDEYSNDHFLIMALEGRLNEFTWNEQFLNNNNNSYYSAITKNGTVDYEAFAVNFCMNLSTKLAGMASMFGENETKKFIMDQLSAGKDDYKEDVFFQAFSEIEILTFFHRGFGWKEIKYEPPVNSNGANPEAYFIGELYSKDADAPVEVKVNIEVKTPKFPRLSSRQERILIPTVLLSNEGRQELPKICNDNNVEYIQPRVTKLVDFINSATNKFDYPKENEYNLLYINWAYCDFPSNSFLEAWSLLTNQYNGLLTHPEIATTLPFKHPVSADAYKKITAVIVYTSSIDQLMFCDFRHVWQQTCAGHKFRMFILDDNLKNSSNQLELFRQLTGMNPDPPPTTPAMFACRSRNEFERIANKKFSDKVLNVIEKNALTN